MKTTTLYHLLGVALLGVVPTCYSIGTSTIMDQVAGYWPFDETAGNIVDFKPHGTWFRESVGDHGHPGEGVGRRILQTDC